MTTTTCTVTLDRAYVVNFNLHAIGSVENETGKSLAALNDIFVAAQGRIAYIPIGILTTFVIGAIVAVDPTFRTRAGEVLTHENLIETAAQMAEAWSNAFCKIFHVSEKKATDPAGSSLDLPSSSDSLPQKSAS